MSACFSPLEEVPEPERAAEIEPILGVVEAITG